MRRSLLIAAGFAAILLVVACAGQTEKAVPNGAGPARPGRTEGRSRPAVPCQYATVSRWSTGVRSLFELCSSIKRRNFSWISRKSMKA